MTGLVVWITGLSGAGKSTIAALVVERLRALDAPVLSLDGDGLRAIFAGTSGHDPDDRRRLAISYARLCREVSDQGINVVCATISMVHEVRRWNRRHIPNYQEIYLRAPIEELIRRDPKGLYARALSGEVRNVVGLDLPMEEPEAPDLVIDNIAPMTAEAAADRIWTRLFPTVQQGAETP